MLRYTMASMIVALFLVPVLSAQETVAERKARFPVVPRAKLMVENDLVPQGGLENPEVIDVMKRIPRNRFLPPIHQQIAFRDQAIAIGNAQTISPPYIVAFMTEQLRPKPTDKVLEIGTGSGYQAAVLSLLVDQVYTIEIVEPLGKQAERVLQQLKFDNVHVRVGDGYKGWPEAAPFDSIIVTCSPESIPQPLVDQLREGGRMIIPLGERYQQAFYLCTKKDGKMEKERLTQTLFVPMTGEAEEKRAVLPDPKNPSLVGGGFEEIRDDGTPVGWHYARNVKIIRDEKAPEGKSFARFVSKQDGRPKSQTNRPEPEQFAQVLQGFAVDGREVSNIKVEYSIRGQNIIPNKGRYQALTGLIWLYDEDRNQIGETILGRIDGTFDWKRIVVDVPIAKTVREAVFLIGIPVATGQLDVDNVIVRKAD